MRNHTPPPIEKKFSFTLKAVNRPVLHMCFNPCLSMLVSVCKWFTRRIQCRITPEMQIQSGKPSCSSHAGSSHNDTAAESVAYAGRGLRGGGREGRKRAGGGRRTAGRGGGGDVLYEVRPVLRTLLPRLQGVLQLDHGVLLSKQGSRGVQGVLRGYSPGILRGYRGY